MCTKIQSGGPAHRRWAHRVDPLFIHLAAHSPSQPPQGYPHRVVGRGSGLVMSLIHGRMGLIQLTLQPPHKGVRGNMAIPSRRIYVSKSGPQSPPPNIGYAYFGAVPRNSSCAAMSKVHRAYAGARLGMRHFSRSWSARPAAACVPPSAGQTTGGRRR